jgi:hypothetical protein
MPPGGEPVVDALSPEGEIVLGIRMSGSYDQA